MNYSRVREKMCIFLPTFFRPFSSEFHFLFNSVPEIPKFIILFHSLARERDPIDNLISPQNISIFLVFINTFFFFFERKNIFSLLNFNIFSVFSIQLDEHQFHVRYPFQRSRQTRFPGFIHSLFWW